MSMEPQVGVESTASSAGETVAVVEKSRVADALRIAQEKGQRKGSATAPPDAKVVEALHQLIELVSRGVHTFEAGVKDAAEAAVRGIDAKISKCVSALLHNEEFSRLEGKWRGIESLLARTERAEDIRIELLPVTRQELRTDFRRGFKRTDLYRELYTRRYGVLGGEPISNVIVDEYFGNDPNDLDVLERFAELGAAMHAPILTGVGPELFGMSSFEDLNKLDPSDIPRMLDTPAHARWKSLRENPNSQFLVMCMPRIMARLPYGKGGTMVEGIDGFQEIPLTDRGNPAPLKPDETTWMNAAFAQAINLNRAYHQYNWCLSIAGIDDGGRVESLPSYSFENDRGVITRLHPMESWMSNAIYKAVALQGFLPVVQDVSKDYAVVMETPTVHKPEVYQDPEATRNAKVAADLSYVMAISRIAHFLKVAGAHWLQSFKQKSDFEREVNNWIAQYVCPMDNPSEKQKKSQPLAEAKIEVEEDPEEPGHYRIIMRLRPWTKVTQITAALRLVAGGGYSTQK